jgi:hypothetical protein
MHLNSQAKGPLLDRTLESFLINTEGAIFHAGKNLSGKKTGQENIIDSYTVFFYFQNRIVKKQIKETFK